MSTGRKVKEIRHRGQMLVSKERTKNSWILKRQILRGVQCCLAGCAHPHAARLQERLAIVGRIRVTDIHLSNQLDNETER